MNVKHRFLPLQLRFALAAFLLLPMSARGADTIHPPDYVGKKDQVLDRKVLTYDFGWGGIPAAEAEVSTETRVHAPGTDQERKYVVVKAEAATYRVIDLLWKMRDKVTAILEPQTYNSIYYEIKQHENRLRKNTRISWEDGMINAEYEDKRRNRTSYNAEPAEEFLDPVAAAYQLRNMTLKVGEKKSLKVFLKRKWRVDFEVQAIETITVEAGTFEAIRLKPTVHNLSEDKAESKLKEMTIWVGTDPDHTLLRIESEVFIGSVFSELVHIGEQPAEED